MKTTSTAVGVAAILEGIHERGEIVALYGDRSGPGHGRLLSHAIRMVQSTVTPGGDKNGADINPCLDAPEMAFTTTTSTPRDRRGDSDSITLVEKLKQQTRKFPCRRAAVHQLRDAENHEFIAYENLVGGGEPRPSAAAMQWSAINLSPADRLTLLKSVRVGGRQVWPIAASRPGPEEHTAASIRRSPGGTTDELVPDHREDCQTEYLRHSGRSMMVDLADATSPADPVAVEISVPPQEIAGQTVVPPVAAPAPAAVDPVQAQQLFQRVQDVFHSAAVTPRWPLYVRQLKQYLRAGDPTFDERLAGFPTTVEFLKACQREGVLHLDRDRRGQLRVFPGVKLARSPVPVESPVESSEKPEPDEPSEPVEIESVEVAIDPPRPGGGRSPRRPRARKTPATKAPKRGARMN